jgi:hemoglobin
MDREIYTPQIENAPPTPELRTLYLRLGEDKIRKLVDTFYNLIQISSISEMFTQNPEDAKLNQADFLIQVLGGPSYYSDRKGHPRMRMRHFAFEIKEESRLVWFNCYKEAIGKVGIPEKEKEILESYLDTFSKWMVNSI